MLPLPCGLILASGTPVNCYSKIAKSCFVLSKALPPPPQKFSKRKNEKKKKKKKSKIENQLTFLILICASFLKKKNTKK
jgi:hypothetical protein